MCHWLRLRGAHLIISLASNFSPVLWPPSRCKIRGPRAIGVLRIIVEREMEIERSTTANIGPSKRSYQRHATKRLRPTDRSGWQKLDKFDLENATQAELAAVKSRHRQARRRKPITAIHPRRS
jgi:hypothetical protein